MRLAAPLPLFIAALVLSSAVGCGEGDDDKDEPSLESYAFKTAASVTLKSTGAAAESLTLVGTEPPMCKDNICITPTNLTGKYYAAGLLIQSAGNGMLAYFGQDTWSATVGTATTYDFDFAAPEPQTGNLICCSGEGDLNDENTYVSDAVYMFGYVDATFTVTEASGAHGTAIGTHTVRFILATGAVTGGKRGDLQYQDEDGEFKWMSEDGSLATTRPASPITMDSSVVDWTNPFGEGQGNAAIPVISASIVTAAGDVMQTNETELNTAGRTYAFDLDMTGFIAFPTLLKADVGMLESRQALLAKLHMQGLPHSKYQMSDAGDVTLTITGP